MFTYNIKVRKSFMAILLAFLCSCSHNYSNKWIDLVGVKPVESNSYESMPAVVLINFTDVTFIPKLNKQKPYIITKNTKQVQLFSDEAHNFINVKINSNKDQKLLSLVGKIIKPNKKTIIITPKYIKEKSHTSAKLNFSHAKAGDIIEYSSEIKINNSFWLKAIAASGKLPTVKGMVVLNIPKSYNANIKVTKLGKLVNIPPILFSTYIDDHYWKTKKKVEANRYIYVFKNEPSLFTSKYQASPDALSTQIHVAIESLVENEQHIAAFNSWQNVADWFSHRFKLCKNNQTIRNIAEKIRTNKDMSNFEKIKAVQNFVNNFQVKYANLFYTQKCFNAEQINYAKQLSKQEKTILSHYLLQNLGVKTQFILTANRYKKTQNLQLITPDNFDKLILMTLNDKNPVFIDLDNNIVSKNYPSGEFQGQSAMVIDHNYDFDLLNLPISPAHHSQIKFYYDLNLSKLGLIQGSASAVLTGLNANLIRSMAANNRKLSDFWQQLLPNDAKLKWTNLSFKDSSNNNDAVHIYGDIEPIKVGTDQKKIIFSIGELFGSELNFDYNNFANVPILFKIENNRQTKLRLSLPNGFKIASLPANIKKSSAALNVAQIWAQKDNNLLLSRNIKIQQLDITPRNYYQLKQPSSILNNNSTTKILVIPFIKQDSYE